MGFIGDHEHSDRDGSDVDSLITSAEAKERWREVMDALNALAFAQSYSIGDRTVTRADEPDLRRLANYWARQFQELRSREEGNFAPGYRVADFRYGPI